MSIIESALLIVYCIRSLYRSAGRWQVKTATALSFISLITTTALPEHLTPRTNTDSLLVVILFTICGLIVAVARTREKAIFLYLVQGVLFLKPLDDLSKEAYKARSSSSILLLILFFAISAGAVYWLFFVKVPFDNWDKMTIPVFVPSFYFLYQLLMTNLAARISGRPEALTELNYFTLVLTQFFGLVLLLEFFVIYFQPAFVERSAWLLGATYLAYLLIRLLRGFWIAMSHGVSWYYIILYFWTLEILPLFVAARLLFYKEFQDWIG